MPFIEKRARTPETGMTDGFEEVDRNFRLEYRVFRPGKQDHLFRPSFTPGNFHWNDPKSCYVYNRNFTETLWENGKTPERCRKAYSGIRVPWWNGILIV